MLAGAGQDPSVVLPTVLPFLGQADSARVTGTPFTVTFAAQPGVPGPRTDREFVIRRLIRTPLCIPSGRCCSRCAPGSVSTPPIAKITRTSCSDPRLGVEKPANLHVVHGNMGEVLDRTDLLVTVSSTAAVEAMHRGIPTAILTDFGSRNAWQPLLPRLRLPGLVLRPGRRRDTAGRPRVGLEPRHRPQRRRRASPGTRGRSRRG